MRGLVRAGLIATLAISAMMVGCEEGEPPASDDELHDDDRRTSRNQGDEHSHGRDDDDLEDEEDVEDEDSEQNPVHAQRTQVPDEIVGTWQDGAFSLETWVSYKQGTWAGRNAVPTRERMTFSKNGDAKFYRYEGLFNFYEELIDCEGTVTFNGNGTFTFYPIKGRKRFFDARYSPNNVDRALTAAELLAPKLAGTRAYTYDGSSSPAIMQIKVPTSAAYNWYKQE